MSNSVSIEGGSIAEMVIHRFGGMAGMERNTRFTYAQIRNMRRRGNLSEEQRAKAIEDAKASGIPLSSVDFIKHLVPFG